MRYESTYIGRRAERLRSQRNIAISLKEHRRQRFDKALTVVITLITTAAFIELAFRANGF